MTNLSKEKYSLVQALRGLAALWVVLFHASEGKHIDALKSNLPDWVNFIVFDSGDNGVAIFFALSGFVIAHSIRDSQISLSYLGRFAIRRAVRLDPPYWAAILFVIGLGLFSSVAKDEDFSFPSLAQITAHAFYLQTILGYNQINSVFWTLTYEVQFYLFLVCLVGLAQKLGYTRVLPFAFLIAVIWGCGLLPNPIPGLFVSLWHSFFVGTLAYWAIVSRKALAAMMLLSFLLIVSTPSAFTVVSVLTALGLYFCSLTGLLYTGLQWRWIQFLGAISYSLYLTHNPITGAAFFVLKGSQISDWVALPIVIGFCIILAWGFWWAFERPSQHFAKQIKLHKESQSKLSTVTV